MVVRVKLRIKGRGKDVVASALVSSGLKAIKGETKLVG